jgi:hypothetical protein
VCVCLRGSGEELDYEQYLTHIAEQIEAIASTALLPLPAEADAVGGAADLGRPPLHVLQSPMRHMRAAAAGLRVNNAFDEAKRKQQLRCAIDARRNTARRIAPGIWHGA